MQRQFINYCLCCSICFFATNSSQFFNFSAMIFLEDPISQFQFSIQADFISLSLICPSTCLVWLKALRFKLLISWKAKTEFLFSQFTASTSASASYNFCLATLSFRAAKSTSRSRILWKFFLSLNECTTFWSESLFSFWLNWKSWNNRFSVQIRTSFLDAIASVNRLMTPPLFLNAENLLDLLWWSLWWRRRGAGLSGRLIGVRSSFMLGQKLGSCPVCGVELAKQPRHSTPVSGGTEFVLFLSNEVDDADGRDREQVGDEATREKRTRGPFNKDMTTRWKWVQGNARHRFLLPRAKAVCPHWKSADQCVNCENSAQLQTVWALYDQETARNKGKPNYSQLKTAVKTHIDQMMGTRNFRVRSDVEERGSVTKSQQGKKAYVKTKVGECFQWKAHGQCFKGDSCSFTHDTIASGNSGEGQRRKGRSSSLASPFEGKADWRRGTNTRHVNSGILPCVSITSLKKDVYKATNAISDM